MILPSHDKKREAAERICRRLSNEGFRALLAGGCVRDVLLNIPPQDYDIATDARPEDVARLFDRTLDVGAQFGVQVVIESEGAFEVTTFRTDGPYLDGRRPSHVAFADERADAQRRDFTINAMFLDPKTQEIIDYVGGKKDLDAGVIRTVGDPNQRFEEDHLRLLRAIRFAARFGFVIEPTTRDAIKRAASQILHTSAERVRDELIKILTQGNVQRAFELLDETGLIEHILPEVAAMKGVQQPEAFHPEGDVFVHTLRMLDLMNAPTPTLAFGVLLHDAGKPLTQSVTDRIRFNNHAKIGAEIAAHVCERLRLPTRDTQRIAWLVREHMRLSDAPHMRESRLKRFVRQEGFPELLELGRLDCLASHRSLDTIEWLEDYLKQQKPEELRPRPLLTGQDLIALGYTPGPLFSRILQALENAQLEGAVSNPEEAKQYILATWPHERTGGNAAPESGANP